MLPSPYRTHISFLFQTPSCATCGNFPKSCHWCNYKGNLPKFCHLFLYEGRFQASSNRLLCAKSTTTCYILGRPCTNPTCMFVESHSLVAIDNQHAEILTHHACMKSTCQNLVTSSCTKLVCMRFRAPCFVVNEPQNANILLPPYTPPSTLL